MATGTGIAPIKAFSEDFSKKAIRKNIYVICGGRFAKDLYDDFTFMGVKHGFIRALSREVIDNCFDGYVQDALLDLGVNLKKNFSLCLWL
jgi:NAD(P)H-flavin reductase